MVEGHVDEFERTGFLFLPTVASSALGAYCSDDGNWLSDSGSLDVFLWFGKAIECVCGGSYDGFHGFFFSLVGAVGYEERGELAGTEFRRTPVTGHGACGG
jgi:hypothetical protein